MQPQLYSHCQVFLFSGAQAAAGPWDSISLPSDNWYGLPDNITMMSWFFVWQICWHIVFLAFSVSYSTQSISQMHPYEHIIQFQPWQYLAFDFPHSILMQWAPNVQEEMIPDLLKFPFCVVHSSYWIKKYLYLDKKTTSYPSFKKIFSAWVSHVCVCLCLHLSTNLPCQSVMALLLPQLLLGTLQSCLPWPPSYVTAYVSRGNKGVEERQDRQYFHLLAGPAADSLLLSVSVLFSLRLVSLRPFHFRWHISSDKKHM